jgi:TnpA family transposase
LRKLGGYRQQNRLYLALGEIGRIERTLFTLDWLENPELRRDCQAGINKGEARHTLAKAVFAHSQGRIYDRSDAAQQKRAMALNMVIAAVLSQSFHLTEEQSFLDTVMLRAQQTA